MLRSGTIDEPMHDAAKDFQAAFIVAKLDPLRALPILRVPGTGREPELNERQIDARRRGAPGARGRWAASPARPARASGTWSACKRSVREWAIRQGWAGRPVDQKEAKGILVAALGMLASQYGYGEARRAS